MTDTVVLSTNNTGTMMKYPLFLQDTSGASSLAYSVDDLRLLNALSITSGGGVRNWDDFGIIVTGALTITVGSGIGVVQTGATGALEYYAFRSTGPTTIPIYPSSGVARTHLLCAQVFDHQLSYTTTAPSWGYVLVQDTGGGTVVPTNAIPLSTISVSATNAITTSYVRYPFQNEMTCSVSGSITGTGFPSGFALTPMSFDTNLDNYWVMWTNSDPTKIYIRQGGIYNIHFSLSVPNTTFANDSTTSVRAYIEVNGNTNNRWADFREATNGGTTCHAIATGVKILPSTGPYVRALASQNGPAGPCSYSMTVQRTEYRDH